jgi:hypothetical protein
MPGAELFSAPLGSVLPDGLPVNEGWHRVGTISRDGERELAERAAALEARVRQAEIQAATHAELPPAPTFEERAIKAERTLMAVVTALEGMCVLVSTDNEFGRGFNRGAREMRDTVLKLVQAT